MKTETWERNESRKSWLCEKYSEKQPRFTVISSKSADIFSWYTGTHNRKLLYFTTLKPWRCLDQVRSNKIEEELFLNDKTMDDFVKEINSARVQSRDQESRNETKRNETKRNLNIAWKLKRHAAAFRPPQISLFRGKTHEFVSFTPWKSCCTTALNFRHVSGTIQQDRGGARFE